MKIAMLSSWHVHAKGYAKEAQAIPGVEIVAVWDENPAAGKPWAEELGAKFYDSLDELLADDQVEAVLVCAPTNMHPEVLIKAANAKKHIFTEKVLALTSADCEKIRDAVEKSGVTFTISYPHKCRADVQKVKQMLDEGLLGKITYARVRNAHNGSSAGWLPDSFYDKETCGGGAMMDLGAHGMYLLDWFLGMPKTIASAFTKVTGKPVEDNAVSVFEYADGCIAINETGFVSSHCPFSIEICGTDGALLLFGDQLSYANGATEGKWTPVSDLPAALPMPINQWVDSVTKGTKPYLDMESALHLTRLMEAAYASDASGSKAEVK